MVSVYTKHDHEDKLIAGFSGEYRWLSNFHACDVMWNSLMFPSSEHAYQFAKVHRYDRTSSKALSDYNNIIKLSPSDSKLWAVGQMQPPGWPQQKFQVMYAIVLDKFMRNSELKEKLKKLEGYYLEERNHWNDTTWGTNYKTQEGSNWLGIILMDVLSVVSMQ